jgi:hypothetical protein
MWSPRRQLSTVRRLLRALDPEIRSYRMLLIDLESLTMLVDSPGQPCFQLTAVVPFARSSSLAIGITRPLHSSAGGQHSSLCVR